MTKERKIYVAATREGMLAHAADSYYSRTFCGKRVWRIRGWPWSSIDEKRRCKVCEKVIERDRNLKEGS